jgi:hypothetical protein
MHYPEEPDLAIWTHNLLLYPWFLLILDDSSLLAKLVTLTPSKWSVSNYLKQDVVELESLWN